MSKLTALKNVATDRAKVLAWLAHIEETAPLCIEEVLAHCKLDPEARAYYVQRYEEVVPENFKLAA